MAEVFRRVIEELAREEMIMENQGAIELTETSGENNDVELVTARFIGKSKIKEMFTWIIKTTFNCTICGEENTFYDAPTTLMVNIPEPDASRADRNIKQCLPRSTAFYQENLEKKCSECKLDITTTARSIVVKSPDIALLQICRDDGTGGTEKSKTEVHFPRTLCFENLGLQDSDMAKPENKDLTKHKLGVISNHKGPITNAGHYTTFVIGIENEEDQCYLSDDKWVTKVDKSEIDSKTSRMESYCFVYYKEGRRPSVPVSLTENVTDNGFDNPQPGPSTTNISSKGTFLFYYF